MSPQYANNPFLKIFLPFYMTSMSINSNTICSPLTNCSTTVYIAVLQSILQYYSLYCSTTVYIAVLQSILQYYSLYCSTTVYIAVLQSILQYYSLYCSTTVYIAVLQSILQYYSLYCCTTVYIAVLQSILQYYSIYCTHRLRQILHLKTTLYNCSLFCVLLSPFINNYKAEIPFRQLIY